MYPGENKEALEIRNENRHGIHSGIVVHVRLEIQTKAPKHSPAFVVVGVLQL